MAKNPGQLGNGSQGMKTLVATPPPPLCGRPLWMTSLQNYTATIS